MTALAVRGLACERGGRAVFAGLDFALDRGNALLLVGPNGTGKSSLLRLLAGLARPASGAILWDGASVADDPEAHRARLTYVGHQDAIKPALTLAENVAFAARLRGPAAAPDAVAAALAAFALDRLAEFPARFLSQGQRRRLALARLIVAPAALWLLDEPSAGLDRASTALLAQAAKRHRARGGAIVAATHEALDWPDTASLTLGSP